MQHNIELEAKVIKQFVEKNKHEIYIWSINSVKNRNKFTSKLAHFNEFQWGKFDKLKGDSKEVLRDIFLRLRLLKLSSVCYIISEDTDLDGKTYDLEYIFTSGDLYKGYGSILVFGNADVIYFHGEDNE